MDIKHFFLLRIMLYTAFGVCIISYGQDSTNGEFDYGAELYKMIKIPNSPEAEAFSKYGDTPVSLHTGTPTINIPLYTIEGRELSLPISLTYDATGIKVEQLATWVGLGWNLNIGGRITRQINGLADDYITGAYTTINDVAVVNKVISYKNNNTRFSSLDAARDYFRFLKDLSNSYIDTEPDYYHINVLGINETFAFDIKHRNRPRCFTNPRIKIQKSTASFGGYHSVDSWVVTGEDGTRYWFEVPESTKRYGNDAIPGGAIINEYNSSWLLTKIVSPNKKDIYTFQYTNFGYWSQEQLGSSAAVSNIEFKATDSYFSDVFPTYGGRAGYWIKQQFLSSIKHNGKTIVSTGLENRHDIDNAVSAKRLSRIDIKNSNAIVLKSFEFDNNDYFNLDGGNPAEKDPLDIRLKLNSISIKGKNDPKVQSYRFEYHKPRELPSRKSLSQDYLGYYNGAGNGTSLIPSYTTAQGIHFNGANRAPNENYGKIGILNKIVYPTGGFTEFVYEGHEILKTETSLVQDTRLDLGIHGNSVTDPALYFDENGAPCDDGFLPKPPKIKIETFHILKSGQYRLNYNGNPNDMEAYIVFLKPLDPNDCKDFPPRCPDPHDNYDSYCDFIGQSAYWHSSMPIDSNTRFFEQGTYKAMVVLDEGLGDDYDNVRLNIYDLVPSTTSKNVPIGGIRIKKIKDFNNDGQIAKIKNYTYRNSLDHSTAVRNNYLNLSTIKNYRTKTGEKTQLERMAVYPKADQPYVTYKSVKEDLISEEGKSNGSALYSFYSGSKGAVPRTTQPYENNYRSSFKVGNIRKKINKNFDNQNINNEEITYFETYEDALSIHGLIVYTDFNYRNKAILLKENNNSLGYYVSYEFKDALECNDIGGGGGSLGGCVRPDYVVNYQNYGYSDVLIGDFSALRVRFSIASGKNGGIAAVEKTDLYYDNQDSIQCIKKRDTLIYDPIIDYLPRKSITQHNDSIAYETNFFYPRDMQVLGSSDLISINNLSEIVKTEVIQNINDDSKLISSRKQEYSKVSNGIVMPTKISVGKGNLTEYDTVDYLELTYYNNGNVKESQGPEGINTAYLWGYHDQYPIAKIDNATNTDVTSYISNLQALSNADDDRTQGYLGKEGVLRQALDDLRTTLPNAMVTTFTYDPLIGVTSMTDPKGYTTYYEYDDFNRLEFVKDAEGNLISENKYRYKNQN